MTTSNPQYKKLVQSFRISIRRRQIDQLFQHHRKQQLQKQIEDQKQQLQVKLRLKDNESRQIWIHQIAQKLNQFVLHQWVQLLKSLYYAVAVFQNQHMLWMQLGILKILGQLFDEQKMYKLCHINNKQITKIIGDGHYQQNEYNKQIKSLRKLSANILTDILYLSSRSNNPKIIKNILELQFIQDLLNLMYESQQIQYLRLVSIICDVAPTIRNYLIDNFGLSKFFVKQLYAIFYPASSTQNYQPPQFQQSQSQRICLKLGLQQFKNTQYLYTLLYLLLTLVKIHQFDKETYSKPKKQTTFQIIQLIDIIIQYPLNYRCLMILLRMLREICLLEKQPVYNKIINCHDNKESRILEKTIQLLCYQKKPQIRLLSIQILTNFLLSQQIQHSSYLIHKGILDKVYQSYIMEETKDDLRVGLLAFLANLTADQWGFQSIVIQHRMMGQIIIPTAYDSYNRLMRKQAIYILSNMLCKISQPYAYTTPQLRGICLKPDRAQQYNSLSQRLLIEHKIIDIMVRNIVTYNRDMQIMRQILATWREVLLNQTKNSSRRTGPNKEFKQIKFYRIFKHYYRIEELLQSLEEYDQQMEDSILQFLEFFRYLDLGEQLQHNLSNTNTEINNYRQQGTGIASETTMMGMRIY